jgi:sec-independent protein translocase protein TatA
MFGGIGPMEVVLVLAIALIVLGPKKLPEAARSVGKGLREFRDSVGGIGDHEDDEDPRDHHDPTPVAASTAPVPAASPAPVPAPPADPEPTQPPR